MTPRQELGQSAPSSNRIDILLATYNGEKHLDEQMRSLFAQTHRNFVVIARDDHSSDRTPAILARWAEENPDRMVVVSDERGNLGARDNFSLLMERCESPYFAFCGQDDIWVPQKLEVSIKAIQQLESRFGKAVPILAHSDVKIVDDSLQEISQSYFAYKGIDITRDTRLDHLLINNVAVGCSLMANRVLLKLSSPIPQNFSYEDHWAALVAASCGVIHTILEPTVLYRQHGNNQVGAGPRQKQNTLWDARHVLQQPKVLRTRMTKALRLVRSRAVLLLRAVGDSMPDHNRNVVQAFCLPLLRDEIAVMPWSRRVRLFARFLEIQVRLFPAALRWCY
jgi:glycosyltransferase involved in cell wall biosynthesis